MKELIAPLLLVLLGSANPLAAQQVLEPLVLPRSEFSEPDDGPVAQRPVFNVLQSGAIVHEGEVAFDPAEHEDMKALTTDVMGAAFELRAPLAVNLAFAPTWADAKA